MSKNIKSKGSIFLFIFLLSRPYIIVFLMLYIFLAISFDQKLVIFRFISIQRERRGDRNYRISVLVNFGEIRGTQLAKSTILTSKLRPLGSFQICSDAKERVGCGKQREATVDIYPYRKSAQPWFLSLQWKTCLWTELQPWFLCQQ